MCTRRHCKECKSQRILQESRRRRNLRRASVLIRTAGLKVKDFAKERREGRGLAKSKFSQVWEEIMQAQVEQQPSLDRLERRYRPLGYPSRRSVRKIT
jgi:hypothetical protein